mmetsp:Transcript_24623/g.85642  ORF Transcript_24623/g.85642 Transcript_24623/m.85642 type:complete len:224 (-) Transcript_24623:557-1228(-)
MSRADCVASLAGSTTAMTLPAAAPVPTRHSGSATLTGRRASRCARRTLPFTPWQCRLPRRPRRVSTARTPTPARCTRSTTTSASSAPSTTPHRGTGALSTCSFARSSATRRRRSSPWRRVAPEAPRTSTVVRLPCRTFAVSWPPSTRVTTPTASTCRSSRRTLCGRALSASAACMTRAMPTTPKCATFRMRRSPWPRPRPRSPQPGAASATWPPMSRGCAPPT